MEFPADLKYTKTDEWIRLEGKQATLGISDFAQQQLSDIVFVEVTVTAGEKVEVGTEVPPGWAQPRMVGTTRRARTRGRTAVRVAHRRPGDQHSRQRRWANQRRAVPLPALAVLPAAGLPGGSRDAPELARAINRPAHGQDVQCRLPWLLCPRPPELAPGNFEARTR